jgi:hypothetical protein
VAHEPEAVGHLVVVAVPDIHPIGIEVQIAGTIGDRSAAFIGAHHPIGKGYRGAFTEIQTGPDAKIPNAAFLLRNSLAANTALEKDKKVNKEGPPHGTKYAKPLIIFKFLLIIKPVRSSH